MVSKGIDERSVEETLDAVESIFLAQLEGNAEIFQCVAHFADIFNADAAPRGPLLPGMERSVRLGGPGTPLIREFAFEELGARMRMGSWAIKRMAADALDTRHRLPQLWTRMCAGEVKVGYCRYVASRTRELSVAAAKFVDEAAAEREANAAAEQFARATRSNDHGMSGFYLRATAATIIRFDATVAYLAEALKALGDPDNEDRRRVKACLIMANPTQAVELMAAFAAAHSKASRATATSATTDEKFPSSDGPADSDDDSGALTTPQRFHPVNLPATITDWVTGDSGPTDSRPGFRFDWAKLLPVVKLYVHLSQDTVGRDGDGVARWEGEGPISGRYVRDHLAPYHDFRITPVVDLSHQAPVDAYEIPDSLREAVHLRSPADVFQGSRTSVQWDDSAIESRLSAVGR